MHALIVYESMYGNTHAIAEGIASGLRPAGDVRVVPVRDASDDLVAWADLVVLGGPTHIHGMTRSKTRDDARARAELPESGLKLDPSADGPGAREWLESLARVHGKRAAAFDTRIDMPALLTGRASSGIANGLRHRGFDLIVKPESFLVDKETALVEGETKRAESWGAELAARLTA
jgi:hypothetical protein